MKKTTLLLIGLVFVSLCATSQENTQKAINDFAKKSQAKISFNKNLETPNFIKFPLNKAYTLAGKSLKEKASNFLSQNKSMYAIADANESLKDGIAKTDNYGLKQYTVKQYFKGVPVFDSELRFHFDKNENLTSINGTIISDINVNPVPRLSKTESATIAINLVKNQNINYSGEPLKTITNKLLIFPKGLVQGNVTSKHLAYRIEVRNDVDVREYLFIDAHTGKLVEQFTGIAHALNRSLYEENLANQRYSEGGSTFFLSQWGKNEVAAAGHMYYLFFNAFGVDSYDNAGAEMITINNNPNINCPNATWNGVSANYCDGTASDDVVAHEWGHAYTQYNSNLVYAYESGALNESFSDVWGETVDLLNDYEDEGENLNLRSNSRSSVRWKMGEDASAFNGAIRDMWDPKKNGDPDKVTASNFWCDSGDNGGVHINSGIPNHAYALLVDGGIFNGQTITGLGFTKAAHIFFRAQSEYLTSTSGFADFADAIEASCNDLIGINLEGISMTSTPAGPSGEIITAADLTQVTNTLIAVELRTDNLCVYETILGPSTALCGAAMSNPVFLEDWESGLGAWTVSQLPVDPSTWFPRDWTVVGNLPNGRAGQAIYAKGDLVGDNCGGTDFENGIIRLESPSITMPNYTSGTFSLAFNHSATIEENFDGGNIKYSLDNGITWDIIPGSAFTENAYNMTLNNSSDNTNPMKGEEAFSGMDEGPGVSESEWGQSTIDLSAIGVTANSTLKLRWEFGTDECNGPIGWFVDEIVIYNCSEALSINDFDFLDNNISIYPNPSSGIFNIKMKSISDFQYNIYDITGKEMTARTEVMNNTFQLDLSTYSKGIYFFKVYSSEGAITQKLIVQ